MKVAYFYKLCMMSCSLSLSLCEQLQPGDGVGCLGYS